MCCRDTNDETGWLGWEIGRLFVKTRRSVPPSSAAPGVLDSHSFLSIIQFLSHVNNLFYLGFLMFRDKHHLCDHMPAFALRPD